MRFLTYGVILMASAVSAQMLVDSQSMQTPHRVVSQSNFSSASQPASARTIAVSLDSPVITIYGLCEDGRSSAKRLQVAPSDRHSNAGCKTVITRTEFESLADAIEPNMDSAAKRQLADDYAKLLVLRHEFRTRGWDKDPQLKRAVAFATLRSEAEQTAKKLQELAAAVQETDVVRFYNSNPFFYDTADLLRIYIPKQKRAGATGNPSESEQEMKKVAEALQARASAGEDFAKLQDDAYEAAGIAGTRPPVNIGKFTANELPSGQRPAMALKTGEVSQVLEDQNGFYVLKVLSKGAKPLTEVRPQIRTIVAQQRFTQAMQHVEQSGRTELNGNYFPASVASNDVPSRSFGINERSFGSFRARNRAVPGSRYGHGVTFALPSSQQPVAAQAPVNH